jgi:hypothetical protein
MTARVTGSPRRPCASARAYLAALLAAIPSACLAPTVPPDIYADAASYAASADAAAAPPGDAGTHDAAWGLGVDAGDDPFMSGDAAQLPPNPDCDFSGRWLVTERLVASGLGIQQASLWWLYLEIEQSADDLYVRDGLFCGTLGRRVGALGVSVDMHAAWPALQAQNDPRGRTGKARLSSDRCDVEWSRLHRVLGATMPYYGDPSRPLPSPDQPADDGAAGWEDWDGDGQPGISIHVSGVLNGTRYSASRTWTTYAGKVAKGATTFRLGLDWKQEESVLGVTTDALKAAGVKDANPALHFVQFAKLSDTQARGSDDSAICTAIRDLAPELTADAY